MNHRKAQEVESDGSDIESCRGDSPCCQKQQTSNPLQTKLNHTTVHAAHTGYYRVSLSLEAPNYCLCMQSNSVNFYFVNNGKQASLKHAGRHFERNLVKDVHHRSVPTRNWLETRGSRPNACRLLSLGPVEGQSVQKYTPHNRTTQRRYTPRDSNRKRRHFGKIIPDFGETHSSVLGCERRPVSASIMSRSCFASFPVCVYKVSSHYLNNIIFYRQ